MGTLFKQTQKITKQFQNLGYTVVEKWEHQFLKEKENDVELKEFLKIHTVRDRLHSRDAFFWPTYQRH